MTRFIGSALGCAVLSLCAAACGSDAKDGSSADEPCERTTLVNCSVDLPYRDVAFKYLVHLPPSYDGTKRTPVILNWHGLTSSAVGQALFSQLDAVADREGFIVIYPDSPTNSWNAGTCCGTTPTRDDVGFARAVVADVSAKACVDRKRIYSTGMSNGGFMSHRLACEAADVFAAVAPVAGKVGIPDCEPSRPVPVLHFHGTVDSLVPYNSAALSGEGLDVPGTLKRWSERDGCDAEPKVSFKQGNSTCLTWPACDAGTEITLCTQEGDGHCWPGNPSCPYGASTTDIDASNEIVKFFAKYALP